MTKLRLTHYDPQRVKLPRRLMKQIRLHKLGRFAGRTVWIVNGSVVRAYVDVDFALGGNPARYSYVPAGELWVEDTGDESDVRATAVHEAVETAHMLDGMSYDEAHDLASAQETRLRTTGKGMPVFVPNPLEEIHTAAEETAEEVAAHGHYGFWLAPDGRFFVVENAYEHGMVACEIVDLVLGRSDVGRAKAEVFLEKLGWIRCAAAPRELVLLRGMFPGEWHVRPLTQQQLNAVFDFHRALPPGEAKEHIKRLIAAEIEQMDRDMESNPKGTLTVCMFCKKVIFDDPPSPEGLVSHGVCYACAVEHAVDQGFTPEDLEELLAEQQQ
jgi:hypothetical protein